MERKFLKSGIPGLDGVLGGGFLENSIVTIGGPTGAGKSTLGMQFLYNGTVQYGQSGLYIAIEETRNDFYFHLSGYNWDIKKLEKENKFVLLDYPIHEVDQILNQYSAIGEIINTIGAKRLVIDSVLPVALYFQNDEERKKGFLKFIENLRRWDVTTLIISEDRKATNMGVLPNSQYGIESFTDGWLNLFYDYDEKSQERKRYIEVIKMKGVAHSAKAYPVSVDDSGMKVHNSDEREPKKEQPKEKKESEKPIQTDKKVTKSTLYSRLAHVKERLVKQKK